MKKLYRLASFSLFQHGQITDTDMSNMCKSLMPAASLCVCAACVCVLMRRKWQRWLAAQHRDTDRTHTEAVWQRRCRCTRVCACKTFILQHVCTFTVCQAARVRSPPEELKGHSVTHRYSRDRFSVARSGHNTHTHTQSTEKLIYM